MSGGWIGVDLDGTLAYYDYWRGPEHIGEPIPAMLERVQRWLAEGKDVRNLHRARRTRNSSAEPGKSGQRCFSELFSRRSMLSGVGVKSTSAALSRSLAAKTTE